MPAGPHPGSTETWILYMFFSFFFVTYPDWILYRCYPLAGGTFTKHYCRKHGHSSLKQTGEKERKASPHTRQRANPSTQKAEAYRSLQVQSQAAMHREILSPNPKMSPKYHPPKAPTQGCFPSTDPVLCPYRSSSGNPWSRSWRGSGRRKSLGRLW